MKARFITRCGCTRDMENIPFPPNREIVIPLRPEMSLFHMHILNNSDDMNRPRLGVRIFEFYGMAGDVAEYVETREQRRS